MERCVVAVGLQVFTTKVFRSLVKHLVSHGICQEYSFCTICTNACLLLPRDIVEYLDLFLHFRRNVKGKLDDETMLNKIQCHTL